MPTNKQLTDKQLEILHDHYKETFARLREAELQRDRLFLWVVGLIALLSVEIGYPAAVGGTLGKLSIAGGELNLQHFPLAALLDITWLLVLTLGLRYCQSTVLVNRQYPYLHTLEEAISPAVGGGDLYRREGKVYLRDYPLLLDVAWFAYGILFPLIVMLAALALVVWEGRRTSYASFHKWFAPVSAAAFIASFVIYRIQPAVASRWRKHRHRKTHASSAPKESSEGSDKAHP